jgi:UDPglucose--hexose-1-phosphate uridylyltransferase
MFSIREIPTAKGILQYRKEHFTGLTCRISPDRLNRHIDHASYIPETSEPCPFCRENIFSVTPTFPDGNRIIHGESVTFPNLYPFGKSHIVTVITRDHSVLIFTHRQIVDALFSQAEALQHIDGYASINWNFLPSAGASLIHPHMQGLSDSRPSRIVDQYIRASQQYRRKHSRNYWEAVKMEEKVSERYLFGDEILWSAHAVPVGEREVRGILPISSLDDLAEYVDLLAQGILEILSLYRTLCTYAFNMSIFFDKKDNNNGFFAFCSLISRINPNQLSTSDSAFMERLHLEPVILTLPEDLGRYYRTGHQKKTSVLIMENFENK